MKPPPGELWPRQKMTAESTTRIGAMKRTASCIGSTFDHASVIAR